MADHYLSGERLNQLTERLLSGDATDEESDEVCRMLYTLARHLYYGMGFSRAWSLDEDETVQESVIRCWEVLAKFDPERASAFNFFTTVILNQMRQSARASIFNGQMMNSVYESCLSEQTEWNGSAELRLGAKYAKRKRSIQAKESR